LKKYSAKYNFSILLYEIAQSPFAMQKKMPTSHQTGVFQLCGALRENRDGREMLQRGVANENTLEQRC